jgi:hypothetical protein
MLLAAQTSHVEQVDINFRIDGDAQPIYCNVGKAHQAYLLLAATWDPDSEPDPKNGESLPLF